MNSLPATPHQRGAALEDQLRWMHNIYFANHRAHIWQNTTGGKLRGGKTILMRGRPDFEGVISGPVALRGTHVSFDAKVCASLTYHHHKEQAHQLIDLFQVQEAGGIAFLLISHNLERFFLVWPRDEWADGKCSAIHLDKLASWEGCYIPEVGSYGLPDWLSAVEVLSG